MIRTIFLLLSGVMGVSQLAAAEDVSSTDASATSVTQVAAKKTVTAKAAKTKVAAATQDAGHTDIVGHIDKPMVTNILPWQESKTPKDMLEMSALKDALVPTDRDRIVSETRYSGILNQTMADKSGK